MSVRCWRSLHTSAKQVAEPDDQFFGWPATKYSVVTPTLNHAAQENIEHVTKVRREVIIRHACREIAMESDAIKQVLQEIEILHHLVFNRGRVIGVGRIPQPVELPVGDVKLAVVAEHEIDE